ncbi:hypothetical protein [Spirosoma spitsbergense]|jgi:hypothetical protein|uniref:hypothetical protein n=1 Tax=Spirosoma spitsbergense TaxID=431554 RepID=UPI00036CAAC8|nr:hypothetical protein [Spirosoma spitsbergense]
MRDIQLEFIRVASGKVVKRVDGSYVVRDDGAGHPDYSLLAPKRAVHNLVWREVESAKILL